MIQFMRGNSSSVISENPVLAAGQPFFETNTHKLKIGDGSTYYNSLPYIGEDDSSGSDTAYVKVVTNGYEHGYVQLDSNTRLTFGEFEFDLLSLASPTTVIGQGPSFDCLVSSQSKTFEIFDLPDTYRYCKYANLHISNNIGVDICGMWWTNTNIVFGVIGNSGLMYNNSSTYTVGYLVVSSTQSN